MAVVAQCIIERDFVPDIQTTLYTSSNAYTRIDKLTMTNISASSVTVSVYLVPNGSVAATNNLVVQNKALLPGACYTFPEISGQFLNSGDFLSTTCSATGSLVVSCSGTKITY